VYKLDVIVLRFSQLTFVFFTMVRRIKVRSGNLAEFPFVARAWQGPFRGITLLVERGRSATGVFPSANSTVAEQSSAVEAKKVLLERSQSKKLAAKVAWVSGQRRGTQLADEGGEG